MITFERPTFGALIRLAVDIIVVGAVLAFVTGFLVVMVATNPDSFEHAFWTVLVRVLAIVTVAGIVIGLFSLGKWVYDSSFRWNDRIYAWLARRRERKENEKPYETL